MRVQIKRPIKYHWKRFDQLTQFEVYDMLRLRQSVFMMEQSSLYEDIDGKDNVAHHLFAYNADNIVVGYLRLFILEANQEASFGRLLVPLNYRKQGIGAELVSRAIQRCFENTGVDRLVIAAQAYLEGFYRKKGFTPVGDVYDDAGVQHQNMVLQKGLD